MSMGWRWQRKKANGSTTLRQLAATDWPTARRIWANVTEGREVPQTKRKKAAKLSGKAGEAGSCARCVPTWRSYENGQGAKRRISRMSAQLYRAATQGMPQVATTRRHVRVRTRRWRRIKNRRRSALSKRPGKLGGGYECWKIANTPQDSF